MLSEYRGVQWGLILPLLLGSLVLGTTLAAAQETQTAQASSRVMGALPFADPDSIRTVPGHVQAGAQDTPGACEAAVRFARLMLVRNQNPDTLPMSPLRDTLPLAVQAVGATCRTPFTTATVPVSELYNLFTLAVLLGDRAQAESALDRWLSAPQTLADRGDLPNVTRAKRLDAAVHTYLDESMPGQRGFSWAESQLQPAQALLPRLDALGPDATYWQLDAHTAVVDAMLNQAEREGRWAPEEVVHAVQALLARYDAAPAAARPSVIADDILLLIEARGSIAPHGLAAFGDSLRIASPTVAQMIQRVFEFADDYNKEVADQAKAGTLVPPLTGTFWYNTQGTAMWPQPGRLSLLVVMPNGVNEDGGIAYTGRRQRLIGEIRRLAAAYGTKGLEVTLVTKTKGYWRYRNAPTESSAITGPLSVAQEAAQDSAYYLGYLHLPAMVVVVGAPLTRQPDGHVVQLTPVQFETAYGKFEIVLSDRSGRVIFQAEEDEHSERILNADIIRALDPTIPHS